MQERLDLVDGQPVANSNAMPSAASCVKQEEAILRATQSGG
jgi:hypothetical protein